jgi:hypothetical protein
MFILPPGRFIKSDGGMFIFSTGKEENTLISKDCPGLRISVNVNILEFPSAS